MRANPKAYSERVCLQITQTVNDLPPTSPVPKIKIPLDFGTIHPYCGTRATSGGGPSLTTDTDMCLTFIG